MATKFEYIELDLHSTAESTWCEKLNLLGGKGMRCIWIDRDTTKHVIAVVERQYEEEDRKDTNADPTEKTDG
jgi:hypothetical protein